MGVKDLIEWFFESRTLAPEDMARALKGKIPPGSKGKEGNQLEEGILTTTKKLKPSKESAKKWRKINEEEGTEACTWYNPYHYGNWGIWMKEECLYAYASDLHFQLKIDMSKSVKTVFEVFKKHGMFHHHVEVFATMMEMCKDVSLYIPYKEKVYDQTLLTENCIEEALANRYTYESRYDGSIKKYLRRVFKSQPLGYSNFEDYISRDKWNSGKDKLAAQVQSTDSCRPFHDFFPIGKFTSEKVPIYLQPDTSRPYPEPIIYFIQSISSQNVNENRKKFQKDLEKAPDNAQKGYEKKKMEFELGRMRSIKKMKGYDDLYEIRINGGYRAIWKLINNNNWKALRIGKHKILERSPF